MIRKKDIIQINSGKIFEGNIRQFRKRFPNSFNVHHGTNLETALLEWCRTKGYSIKIIPETPADKKVQCNHTCSKCILCLHADPHTYIEGCCTNAYCRMKDLEVSCVKQSPTTS